MKKYHVSENGPRLCVATKKPCPISAEGEHVSTMKDAEEHYATQMDRNGMGKILSVSKPKTRKNAKAEEPSYFTNDNTEMSERADSLADAFAAVGLITVFVLGCIWWISGQ